MGLRKVKKALAAVVGSAASALAYAGIDVSDGLQAAIVTALAGAVGIWVYLTRNEES
jgi:ribonuclease PH